MKFFSLRNQIFLLAVLPSLLVTITIGLYLIQNRQAEIKTNIEHRAAISARQLAVLAEHHIIANDRKLLSALVAAALEEPGVRSVRFLNRTRHEMAAAGPKMQFFDSSRAPSLSQGQSNAITSGEYYRLSSPVFSNDLTASQNHNQSRELIGWVEIEFSGYGRSVIQYQNYIYGALMINLALMLCVFLGGFTYQSISKRVNRVREWLRSDNDSPPPEEKLNDDFSYLVADISKLRKQQQQLAVDMQHNAELTMADLRETLETVEIQNIELDLARKEAIEASRVKSDFLANTSHEIRTPLNGIIGFANTLLKSATDSRQRSSVETIRNSAENLLTIINDILDFSKLDSGKVILDEVAVNVRELADEALALAAPEAHQKGLELLLFAEPTVPDALLADPLRLRQILTNLINNAIKFTNKGQVRVNLRGQMVAENVIQLRLEVKDTGIGLEKNQLGVVFEPFIQADATTTRQYGGTGLGLVISKRLVETMEGEIGVDSTKEQGSTFWFTLRLKIPETQETNPILSQLSGQKIRVYDPQDMSFHALRNMLDQWLIEVERCERLEDLIKQSNDDTLCKIASITRENSELLCSLCASHSVDGLILATQHDAELNIPTDIPELRKPVSHRELLEQLKVLLGHSFSPQVEQSFAIQGKHVLAIDDNAANLRLLDLLFSDNGADITLAESGIEALKLCRDRLYDFIFVDIQMPVMDGLETSSLIRQTTINSHTPIIAVSAHIAPDNPQSLKNAGIDLYISKPVTEAKIRKATQRVIGRDQESEWLSSPKNEPLSTETNTIAPRPVDIRNSLATTKGNADVAEEMLTMLLDSLPATITKIEQLIETPNINREQLDEISHKLKGACCYSKVPALEIAVNSVEQKITSQASDAELIYASEALIRAAQELIAWSEEVDIETVFYTSG